MPSAPTDLIEFNNKDHGRAIAQAIPRCFNQDTDVVISRAKNGRLLGGVIYDGYTGSCIFVHWASFDKHWINKDMLWTCFHYPFVQLGVKKICGTIPSSNRKLLELDTKLGFKVEAIIRDGYPGSDMLVISMTRDECRWLSITPRSLQAK